MLMVELPTDEYNFSFANTRLPEYWREVLNIGFSTKISIEAVSIRFIKAAE
jgi:hypothetical protein